MNPFLSTQGNYLSWMTGNVAGNIDYSTGNQFIRFRCERNIAYIKKLIENNNVQTKHIEDKENNTDKPKMEDRMGHNTTRQTKTAPTVEMKGFNQRNITIHGIKISYFRFLPTPFAIISLSFTAAALYIYCRMCKHGFKSLLKHEKISLIVFTAFAISSYILMAMFYMLDVLLERSAITKNHNVSSNYFIRSNKLSLSSATASSLATLIAAGVAIAETIKIVNGNGGIKSKLIIAITASVAILALIFTIVSIGHYIGDTNLLNSTRGVIIAQIPIVLLSIAAAGTAAYFCYKVTKEGFNIAKMNSKIFILLLASSLALLTIALTVSIFHRIKLSHKVTHTEGVIENGGAAQSAEAATNRTNDLHKLSRKIYSRPAMAKSSIAISMLISIISTGFLIIEAMKLKQNVGGMFSKVMVGVLSSVLLIALTIAVVSAIHSMHKDYNKDKKTLYAIKIAAFIPYTLIYTAYASIIGGLIYFIVKGYKQLISTGSTKKLMQAIVCTTFITFFVSLVPFIVIMQQSGNVTESGAPTIFAIYRCVYSLKISYVFTAIPVIIFAALIIFEALRLGRSHIGIEIKKPSHGAIIAYSLLFALSLFCAVIMYAVLNACIEGLITGNLGYTKNDGLRPMPSTEEIECDPTGLKLIEYDMSISTEIMAHLVEMLSNSELTVNEYDATAPAVEV